MQLLKNDLLKSFKFVFRVSFPFLLYLKKKGGLRWFLKIMQSSARENTRNNICIEVIMTYQSFT